MERWVKIVEKHCDPEERLNDFMELLQDINALYSNRRFYFNDQCLAKFDIEVFRLDRIKVGGSIVKIPEGNWECDEKYSNSIMYDHKNKMLCYGALRYFNEFLTEIERHAIVWKWFKNTKHLQREQVLAKFKISSKTLPKILGKAEEKLIELWALDFYGRACDSGEILGIEARNWLREKRTGIYGGYMAEYPQWYLHFYPSKNETQKLLEKRGVWNLEKFEDYESDKSS